MTNNRARILSEVLSLDAWHEPFRTGYNSFAIYVEMSFQEGRIGGDNPNMPFTFKINLKKALIKVFLESPLLLDRSSILREIPSTQVEHSKIRSAKSLAESSLVGKAKLSPAALYIALSGELKSNEQVTQEDQLKIVQTIPETLVSARPIDRHSYAWELEPSYNPTLRGQPWDPTIPRLRAKLDGALGQISPSVRVEVNCALDDIDISDLKPKQDNLNQSLRNFIYNDISEAAAIQYLKILLKNADLETGMLDNRFSDLIIANVLAIPQ